MSITLIAAMTPNHVIGKDNQLLWHLPGDLKWFKEHTLNRPIIMGRKTYESIGRPLPNRTNVVVSRTALEHTGVEWCDSLDTALYIYNEDEPVVIGGGEIYKQAMPFADKLIITEVHCFVEGDTYFPMIDKNIWEVESAYHIPADEYNEYARTNYTYIRKKK